MYIGSRSKRWIVGEHLGYIVVCAVDIVIFLETEVSVNGVGC